MTDLSAYPLAVDAATDDTALSERFREVATNVHAAMAVVAEGHGVAPFAVTLAVTDAFEPAVQTTLDEVVHLSGFGRQPFSTERLGGTVAAKNIALAEDASAFKILVDSSACEMDESGHAWLIYLIAHELSHSLMGRLRWQSGALEGVLFPSRTPVECARSITRVAVEEFRADVLADIVLRGMATTTIDGIGRPLRAVDLSRGAKFANQLGTVLDHSVYPGLRDVISQYRHHLISLEEMWDHILRVTDQVFTLLGHCEAESESAGRLGPLEVDYADHPGTELYFGPAWRAVMAIVRAQDLLPTVEMFRTDEIALLDAGETGVLSLWRQLGLTVEMRPNRAFAIWVDEPAA